MMLIRILGFGSNWWARFGHNPADRYRFTRHAAYFNSTGFECGCKIRRHWTIPGLVRFNGVGGFNPHFPNRSLGETFECPDPAFACGGNRLLCARRVPQSTQPDYYLVVVTSDRFGDFNLEQPDGTSESVTPIAVSSLRARQEALLLMKPLAWVRSSLGIWQLKPAVNRLHGASLELIQDPA